MMHSTQLEAFNTWTKACVFPLERTAVHQCRLRRAVAFRKWLEALQAVSNTRLLQALLIMMHHTQAAAFHAWSKAATQRALLKIGVRQWRLRSQAVALQLWVSALAVASAGYPLLLKTLQLLRHSSIASSFRAWLSASATSQRFECAVPFLAGRVCLKAFCAWKAAAMVLLVLALKLMGAMKSLERRLARGALKRCAQHFCRDALRRLATLCFSFLLRPPTPTTPPPCPHLH